MPRTYTQRIYSLIPFGNKLHDQLYGKLVAKSYDPMWFVGVKTTGIACHLACSAGPPLQKNVVFSKNLIDLLGFGLRECKVCKPLSYRSPVSIRSFLNEIESSPAPEKEKETCNFEAIKWVARTHHVDLERYIRVKRINNLLKTSRGSYKNVITYQRYWTPIGIMLGCFTNKGLSLLEFSDRLMLEAELNRLQRKLKANFKRQTNNMTKQLGTELEEYFQSVRHKFRVPLDKKGSDFQQSVWKVLEQIPFGETRSYQQLADLLEKPKAVRAVANANAANSISILVPCHRIIATNGQLTGYGGGLERKKYLLTLESSSKNLKKRKKVTDGSTIEEENLSDFFQKQPQQAIYDDQQNSVEKDTQSRKKQRL